MRIESNSKKYMPIIIAAAGLILYLGYPLLMPETSKSPAPNANPNNGHTIQAPPTQSEQLPQKENLIKDFLKISTTQDVEASVKEVENTLMPDGSPAYQVSLMGGTDTLKGYYETQLSQDPTETYELFVLVENLGESILEINPNFGTPIRVFPQSRIPVRIIGRGVPGAPLSVDFISDADINFIMTEPKLTIY